MPRQSLGRGLSALLGDEKPAAAAEARALEISTPKRVNELDIDLIAPNPEQPRANFGENELEELAASIRANGIVQPIVVRSAGENRYQIVAGERRWRAAQKAGLRKVPVSIKEVSDEKLLEIALIENIQRQQLNPIEEANAFRKLIDSIGLTQEEVSERVGKERTLITTTMRLLKLPVDIQKHLIDGKLSLSHGRALLMSDDAAVQRFVADETIAQGLSVREVERRVKAAKRAPKERAEPQARVVDPNVKVAETRMMRHLSTNVKIVPAKKGTGGKIEIEYYGIDDLNRIYDLLIKNKGE
ncbi:MAG: ParB/RepB/Spo0J family partition protein [Acidobacteria bacterium ACB1]|nr:putative chromosome-partitioning protein ParB [Pyrinomonadaceae bacterium]MCE7962598.1 ParB/RepB/Spo0J family partition protein [Acidobacteria bacterium ACB1]RIJ92020.1 MAG: chromosome partitioning protein ParB [Acidobacteriota bacterium]